MIRAQNLKKQFGETRALDGISFEVACGEVVGFLGPNGAGKTTTMRILAGYLPPSSGSAAVDDRDVLSDSLEVRRRIGYLPEQPPLYREMTVRSLLEFLARIRDVPKERMRARIDEAMGACGVAEVAGRLVGNLSKGYRQRVGVAATLLHDPPVLILDEPTAGLDPRQIVEVRDLIRELGKERTVLLSTHILPEVEAVCDRVLILNRGRIVASDTLEALGAGLGERPRLRLTADGPEEKVREALRGVQGVLGVRRIESEYEVETDPERDVRAAVARALVEGGLELRELRRSAASLEELFVRAVAQEGPAEEEADEDGDPPEEGS
jgi:ABC-2 type transport system ATP-binding protein